jgi:hypothetical protein
MRNIVKPVEGHPTWRRIKAIFKEEQVKGLPTMRNAPAFMMTYSLYCGFGNCQCILMETFGAGFGRGGGRSLGRILIMFLRTFPPLEAHMSTFGGSLGGLIFINGGVC